MAGRDEQELRWVATSGGSLPCRRVDARGATGPDGSTVTSAVKGEWTTAGGGPATASQQSAQVEQTQSNSGYGCPPTLHLRDSADTGFFFGARYLLLVQRDRQGLEVPPNRACRQLPPRKPSFSHS